MQRRKEPPRYPVLQKRIDELGGGKEMLRKTGLFNNSYYLMQKGKSEPTKFTIDVLLAYTGLKYEEAFREKE